MHVGTSPERGEVKTQPNSGSLAVNLQVTVLCAEFPLLNDVFFTCNAREADQMV